MLIGDHRNRFTHEPKPTCDAHQFNPGDVFFTNIMSTFEYRVDFINNSDRFLYSNTPLSAICSFVYYGVKVDTIQRSVESKVGTASSKR